MLNISAATPAGGNSTTPATNPARRSSRGGLQAVRLPRDRPGELVHGSIIIDGAQYTDARTAVEMAAPAMRLTLVIEPPTARRSCTRSSAGCSGGRFPKSLPSRKYRRSRPVVRAPSALHRHHPRAARQEDGVVFFDLSGYDVEGYNKFIPYYLFPEFHLYGVGEPVQFPDEDFGGIEPVDARRAQAQSGHHLRALRRRRATRGWAPSAWPRENWTARARSPRRLWRS